MDYLKAERDRECGGARRVGHGSCGGGEVKIVNGGAWGEVVAER